jgi:hypothetical protein
VQASPQNMAPVATQQPSQQSTQGQVAVASGVTGDSLAKIIAGVAGLLIGGGMLWIGIRRCFLAWHGNSVAEGAGDQALPTTSFNKARCHACRLLVCMCICICMHELLWRFATELFMELRKLRFYEVCD